MYDSSYLCLGWFRPNIKKDQTFNPLNFVSSLKHAKFSRHVCPHIPISDLGMPFGLPHFISNWHFGGFEFPHFSFTFLRMSNFKAPSLIEISIWDAHCKAFHLNAWLPHCLRDVWFRLPHFWFRDANLGSLIYWFFFSCLSQIHGTCSLKGMPGLLFYLGMQIWPPCSWLVCMERAVII